MRKAGMVTATLLAVVMLTVSPPASAGSPLGACQAGGVNTVLLAEMQRQYWEWYVREYWGNGGGELATGRWFFVPAPSSATLISFDPFILQASTSFEVPVGKTLVLSMTVLVGESYVDGSEDPPGLPVDYLASTLLLTVDGRVIADSTRSKLDCLYFDEVYFEEPILYPEPTDYGANAATYVKGLGILLHPLSRGEHIIEMQVVSPTRDLWGVDIGYYTTFYVTVMKP